MKTMEEILKELVLAGGNFPGIYKITHKTDGKVYIGQTSQKIVDRMKQHMTNTNSNPDSANIDKAIRLEGIDAFNYEVLYRLSHLGDNPQELLWELEFQIIDQFDSYNKGYNLTKGNHIKKFQNTVYYIMHTIKIDAFKKYIIKQFNIDLTNKKVLLINSFGPNVKTVLNYFDCQVTEIYTSNYISWNENRKKYEVDKKLYGEYIMEELKKLTTTTFDLIIANPPYGKIGANITKYIIDNISFTDYINLLPANDYKRNDTKDLYNYQSDMIPVNDGFEDADVTTHVARIYKKKVNSLTLDEFEISQYTDNSLTKYFTENRIRKHYAIDKANLSGATDAQFKQFDLDTTVTVSSRDVNHRHLPYSKTCETYRYNVLKNITNQEIFNSRKALRKGVYDGWLSITGIINNTAAEKDNQVKFMYSKDGFRFLAKVFTAVNVDSTLNFGKVFPKVDWTRPWTVEEILTDYGYTTDEIKEVMDDLVNYKYLED